VNPGPHTLRLKGIDEQSFADGGGSGASGAMGGALRVLFVPFGSTGNTP